MHTTKFCVCGETFGVYTDGLNAEYGGDDAVPLGFANSSFSAALRKQPESGWGESFEAFVIPKKCETYKKVSAPSG